MGGQTGGGRTWLGLHGVTAEKRESMGKKVIGRT